MAIRKAFLPLVRGWVDEKSIASNQRQNWGTIVRSRAQEGAKMLEIKIRVKMHRIAMARALTRAGVFPPEKRKVVHSKMNFIFSLMNLNQPNQSRAAEVRASLEKYLGSQYNQFSKKYNETMNELDEEIYRLCFLVKRN